jgi:ABC-type polysaccharide/polyol phosphate transport system ATPase subunit
MPEPLIIADHIWKRYQRNEYRPSLRHEAVDMLKRWTGSIRQSAPTAEPFWALRDVSFTVEQGEAVGVIGHNGAGKSTLFRCLCGVTEPTEGSVTIHGRFAPLIALGAGFNLELSGRQNIYLNTAIQGLSRKRTEELLPQILEFAELGEFIDIPVKRYSSGMTARLGFSVAIFSLPDIVFFDEVLAVGDAAFQEKCKVRIRQFKQEGRTMMFVSHSAAEVRRLCDRALWMHHGQLRMDGDVDAVVDAYEKEFGIPNSRGQKLALDEAEAKKIEVNTPAPA